MKLRSTLVSPRVRLAAATAILALIMVSPAVAIEEEPCQVCTVATNGHSVCFALDPDESGGAIDCSIRLYCFQDQCIEYCVLSDWCLMT